MPPLLLSTPPLPLCSPPQASRCARLKVLHWLWAGDLHLPSKRQSARQFPLSLSWSPPLLPRRRQGDKVQYSLNLIPLGGYVAFPEELSEEEEREEEARRAAKGKKEEKEEKEEVGANLISPCPKCRP